MASWVSLVGQEVKTQRGNDMLEYGGRLYIRSKTYQGINKYSEYYVCAKKNGSTDCKAGVVRITPNGGDTFVQVRGSWSSCASPPLVREWWSGYCPPPPSITLELSDSAIQPEWMPLHSSASRTPLPSYFNASKCCVSSCKNLIFTGDLISSIPSDLAQACGFKDVTKLVSTTGKKKSGRSLTFDLTLKSQVYKSVRKWPEIMTWLQIIMSGQNVRSSCQILMSGQKSDQKSGHSVSSSCQIMLSDQKSDQKSVHSVRSSCQIIVSDQKSDQMSVHFVSLFRQFGSSGPKVSPNMIT